VDAPSFVSEGIKMDRQVFSTHYQLVKIAGHFWFVINQPVGQSVSHLINRFLAFRFGPLDSIRYRAIFDI